MDDAAILAIGVVAALVICAGAYTYFNGPQSPLAASWRKRLIELEVQARMGDPEDVIGALKESSLLYRRLRKSSEAEMVLRRAMLLGRQEFGELYEGLPHLMEEYANLMDSMHRKREAEKMRQDAEKLRQRLQNER